MGTGKTAGLIMIVCGSVICLGAVLFVVSGIAGGQVGIPGAILGIGLFGVLPLLLLGGAGAYLYSRGRAEESELKGDPQEGATARPDPGARQGIARQHHDRDQDESRRSEKRDLRASQPGPIRRLYRLEHTNIFLAGRCARRQHYLPELRQRARGWAKASSSVRIVGLSLLFPPDTVVSSSEFQVSG